MKKLILTKSSVLLIAIIGSSSLFGMDLGKINLNNILKNAKSITDQITISEQFEPTLSSIREAVKNNLQHLPNQILGVDIEKIKRGEIDPAVLPLLKSGLQEVTKYLPAVIAFLKYPDALVEILNDVVYPKVVALVGQNPMGKQLATAMRTALNFAMNNKDAVNNVSQRIASLLAGLQNGFSRLKERNLENMDAMAIAQEFSDLKNKFDAEYNSTFPIIRSFIEANIDALKNIVAQFTALAVTVDIQQVLQRIQNELKSQGFSF